MKLEQIKRGMSLVGVEPEWIVTVKSIFAIAPDTWEITYRLPDGTTREQMLSAKDEERIHLAEKRSPFTFDGDPSRFKLVCEAKRIEMAFLFDPMLAVHTSNIEPLPHQMTAVYESMLPRQPLRFVLADDPGAGKTVMAGLYLRELIMRADAHRILIIAPGSLVEQWQDELFDKFNLELNLFSSETERTSPSHNPFEHQDRWIVRLDQLARNPLLQEKLCALSWDLVIFDEAHKLAAHYFGNEIKPTKRFLLAKKLAEHTRHLLLMTATPHNGKEADFQLFLSLLDADRFCGKFRNGVHKVEVSDLMRRMVKEELVRFDGTPLFPERKAYTINYTLSPLESELYEAVTHYVRTEMGKADALDGKSRNSVGFALTTLQRRLASSPEAIFQSLRRRKERLEKRRDTEKQNFQRKELHATFDEAPENDDELTAAQQEALEEKLILQATAAKTIQELEEEIKILASLEQQAKALVASEQDRKWDELSNLLQHDPAMQSNEGRRRKLIVFTEHRDTLSYLQRKISGLLGHSESIVTIHGATHRDERLLIQGRFRHDPDVFILLATDAAGEGVNLQAANLMVNYDLPWNPNRLEQRFGRIHRIGQVEVCHLWNLVAKETREGDVYHRLLEKLQLESEALQGRVFDILGEVFEETSLKDMLLEAIRYGDRPDVRAKLTQKINQALDHEHLQHLLQRNALAQELMNPQRLFAVREEMEKAEARKLQPFFVRAFFLEAARDANLSIHPREYKRFQITHVPAILRSHEVRARLLRHTREPIQKVYERICFEKEAIQPLDKPGLQRAELIHPGHPLMRLLTQQLLQKDGPLLRQGAIFIDPNDPLHEPSLLFLALHEIKAGHDQSISQRLHFVRLSPQQRLTFAGWAPHLDLEPLPTHEIPLVQTILQQPWLAQDVESSALSFLASQLAPPHLQEVEQRHRSQISKTRDAVVERLTKEILFWSQEYRRRKEEHADDSDQRLHLDNLRHRVNELQARLNYRRDELDKLLHVRSLPPLILGAALVLPLGLMQSLRGESSPHQTHTFAADALARQRVEQLAMQAVRVYYEKQGWRIVDVSAEKCGWDLTAYPPTQQAHLTPQHIEVKGRTLGATTLTVTRNEILYALNQGDKFILAIVFVRPDDTTEPPIFLHKPFDREPDWGADSVNYSIRDLIKKTVAKAAPSS